MPWVPPFNETIGQRRRLVCRALLLSATGEHRSPAPPARPKCNIGHGRRRPQPRVAALDAADGQQAAVGSDRNHSPSRREERCKDLHDSRSGPRRRRLRVASHLIER